MVVQTVRIEETVQAATVRIEQIVHIGKAVHIVEAAQTVHSVRTEQVVHIGQAVHTNQE